MKLSFYFYDLETSSGSPRDGRIMQFAGRRTDEHLQPIGDPDNILIKLADDVIPDPFAILVHGITPQETLQSGITEKEFCKYFTENVALSNTIFVGYNNIRFDDEFMRRILYRTFYDPYEWHWKDGRGRWDLMDPMRMMRALRPEGIKWPVLDGKPTVKLELLAKENKLTQERAHDALSDVTALVELAQKFKQAQPRLFSYLLSMSNKKKVANIVDAKEPFLYTSGKYPSEYDKTTAVVKLLSHPRGDAGVVYNLREDPSEWFDKSVDELVKHWSVRYGDDLKALPVKTIRYNRCPAVAPMGVLDTEAQERIDLDPKLVEKHETALKENIEFKDRMQKALDIMEQEQQTRLPLDDSVDNQIYDGFWSQSDQRELQLVRNTKPSELSGLSTKLHNKRMRELLPLYIARNFPKVLTAEQRQSWDIYRAKQFTKGGKQNTVAKTYENIQEIRKNRTLNKNDDYLLTELQLYVESILPEPEE